MQNSYVMKKDNPTPLLTVLRSLTVDEQHDLADMAGTTRNYLYQLASCDRKPRLNLGMKIGAATRVMNKRTEGRCPVLSVQELGQMCATA